MGKASVGMTVAAMELLGGRLSGGVVTVNPEEVGRLSAASDNLKVFPCDHPFPTSRNVEAARAVADVVGGLEERDTLLVLISGGGSAHLTLPWPGLTVQGLADVTRALQRAGAPITDINAVRKHCEVLKGGRLAAKTRAGRVVTLIMSDVIGDRLDVIASGPTVADVSTFADAVLVLERYGVVGVCPTVTRHIALGAAGEIDETPKPGHPAFDRVTNTAIASNGTVVDAVVDEMRSLGFEVSAVVRDVEGDAAAAGRRLAGEAGRLRQTGVGAACCVVLGGETTVDVGAGTGTGGPSQEVALSAAVGMDGVERVALVAFSTDGRDGPTDAAGAIVTGETWGRARAMGLDPTAALLEHDSYGLLGRVGALVRTGPTGTNLNHVAVLMVYP